MQTTPDQADEQPQLTKEVPCAYCNGDVAGTAFVICATCEIPLHRDCWNEARRCPAYGCGSDKVLDPAVAIFRKPIPAAVVQSASASNLSGDSTAGGASPAAGSPGGVEPPAGQPSTLGTITKILASDKKIAAVSIDLHLGESWPTHLAQLWPFGRKPSTDPSVVKAHVLATNSFQEIELMEREIADLRHRLWVRKIGFISGLLLAPMLLHAVGSWLFLPIVVALVSWATWPGWRARDSKRREKALQARIDQLLLPPAPRK